MRIIKRLKDLPFVMNALRAVTLIAGVLGTLFALLLASYGGYALSMRPLGMMNIAGVVGIVTVVCVSICCWAALLLFYRLCGHLRENSLFTAGNVQALYRISKLCFISGILVLAGVTIVSLVMRGFVLPIFLLCFSFAFFGASLLCHALSLLISREMQPRQESELTFDG